MSEQPKLMVVHDEMSELDLLYRTFRREFHVLRFDAAANAMWKLDTEGEMAVILSAYSQVETPEPPVDFFGKTKDRFPDTVWVLLTPGSVDDERLDYYMSDPSVFQCIAEPYSSYDLQAVVQEAASIYHAAKSNK